MRRNLLYTLGLWVWLAPALLFGQLNFTVSNTNDDGPGSLRDAVRQASGRLIEFSACNPQ